MLQGLALEHHRAGRLAEAEAAYRAILAERPDDIDALHLLGVVAHQTGRHAQAADLISRSLARNGANAPAHSNLAMALAALGRLDEALAHYRAAIALQPDLADAWLNQSNALRALGQHDAAVASLRRAIALRPGHAESHSNLGDALRELGQLEEAADSCQRALALNPALAQAHCNLGNVHDDRGDADAAVACYRRSIALQPDLAVAHCNLGTTLQSLGLLGEADGHLQEALRLQPDLARAAMSRAHLKLMQGDYAAGFALYERRFDPGALSGFYTGLRALKASYREAAQWQGEPLEGKRLLVWMEQGLGDCLMMLRFLPLLKQRGLARLVVRADAPLRRVLQCIPAVDEVIPADVPPTLASFDWHCPLMSLPLRLGMRLESIPRQVPYLTLPHALQHDWAGKLSRLAAPRVGLVWSGGALYPKNAARSIRLERLGPVLGVEGASFVNLQQGAPARQLAGVPAAIHDWMAECGDLLDTAGLIGQLDLVIGVDTSVTHLAGALGRPVWMLNRFESEWRWLLQREDSPWYPTMRILRQPGPGRWDEVVARAASDLRRGLAAWRAQGKWV